MRQSKLQHSTGLKPSFLSLCFWSQKYKNSEKKNYHLVDAAEKSLWTWQRPSVTHACKWLSLNQWVTQCTQTRTEPWPAPAAGRLWQNAEGEFETEELSYWLGRSGYGQLWFMKEQHGKGYDSPISTSWVLGMTPYSYLCPATAQSLELAHRLLYFQSCDSLRFGASFYVQLFLFRKNLARQQLQQVDIKPPTNGFWAHPLSKGISNLISVLISSFIIHRILLELYQKHFIEVCEGHLRKINIWPKNLVTVVSSEKAWHYKWKADVSE